MRRLSRVMIGFLLGATVAAPIAAQAQENEHRGQRGDWQRGGDGGRRNPDNAGWRGGGDRGAMMNGRREAIEQARESRRQIERPTTVMQPRTPPELSSSGDGRRWRDDRDTANDRGNWARGRRDDNGEANRDRNGDRHDWNREHDWNRDGSRNWTGKRRDWNRDGYRSWSSDRHDWNRSDHRRWDRDWRNDRRYGWRDHRTRNRSIYRLPRYEARHGYSYRRWYAGYRWDPWFYSSAFWISDPWQYRLPAAYGPYRWVRYYDDVVLVDIDTGEIVDIIHDFFW